MRFSDQEWDERKKMLGGPSEDCFVRFAKRNKIQIDRYGFDNSPIKKFSRLPEFVRFTPDFACVGKTPFLVECKGTGRGTYFSLKEIILGPLLAWNLICPVYLFFYDSDKKRYSFNSLVDIVKLIEEKNYERGEWYDWGVAKPYVKIPKTDLVWEDDIGEV